MADITKAFRAELTKIMPGYKWTVHKSSNPIVLRATGIMSSGSNRLSTLEVIRDNDGPWYRAASAGHGTRAQFGKSFGGKTLARALRDLQSHYEHTANTYRSLAARLEDGRRNVDAEAAP
jgi:hypothetical protein